MLGNMERDNVSATASTWRKVNRLFIIALASIVLAVGVSVHRDAQANPVFLPLIIGVMFSGLMGVGTAIEMWDGAPDTSSVVGAKALSVTIANPADNGAAEGAVRVPTTPSSDSANSIPAPPPPSGTVSPTTSSCYFWGQSGYPDLPCKATADLSCSTAGGTMMSGKCYAGSPQVGYQNVYENTTTTCPPGYTYGSGTCTVSNTRQIVEDGKQDLTRSGTTLAIDTADKRAAVNAVLSTLYVSNDSADVSGISVSGQPRMVRTTAKSDGGSEVTQITQKTDGAGNSYLEKRQYVIDPDGIVKSASQSAVPGALEKNGPGTGYAVSGGTGTFTPAAPGSGSGVAGSGTGATDYARQGEAAAAAASVVGALTAPSGSYPTTPGNGADVVQDGISGLCTGPACASDSVLNPGFDWLPSFLPGAAECTPIEFRGAVNVGPAAGLDSTTTFDMCWMLQLCRDIFGWLINVTAVVYIWRRFTNMYNGG